MATPRLHKRGDIVVMVALDPTASPSSPTFYTNFCGATGISLNIENAIGETNVGDCEDWTLPTQTVLDYGAQTVGMTINAQLARSNRDKLLRWAKDQLVLPVRTFFVDAEEGEVEYIDGMGMLPALNIENIGSTEQNAVVTTTLNLRFQEGVEFIDYGQVMSAPEFTIVPSLIGSTALGGTIIIDLGAASGVPAPVLTGTLSRPGVSPVAVTHGQQITIAAGDQGGSLSLTAIATNSEGSDTETVVRAVPAADPAAAPAITASPVITGGSTAGGTLSSTIGTASGSPAPNATRQWLADGVAIAGATGATLDTTGRAGQSISLRVTWSNGTGSPAVATSNAIAIVAAPTAPVPFVAGDWSLATGLEANQLIVNIASLPASNGSPITAIQYSANGGTWTALPGGAETGPRTLTMPAAATSYSIRLRAVNAAGNSTPSDTKTATSGAAAGPAAYLGIVATNLRIPTASTTSSTRYMARTHHKARDAITALQVELPNWWWQAASGDANYAQYREHATGAPMNFRASVEYPAGTFTQLTFGGQVEGSAPAGGSALTDSVPVAIPDGASFWVRVYGVSTWGITFVNATSGSRVVQRENGEALEYGPVGGTGTAAVSDKTMGGDLAPRSVSDTAPICCPVAIIAQTVKPSLLLVGDSRVWGQGDTFDADGNKGELARGLGPHFGYINVGSAGDSPSDYLASNARRTSLAQWCSHVVSQAAINALRSGTGQNKTAATVLSEQQQILALFPSKRRLTTTTMTRTTSTDSWATVANQTPIDVSARIIEYNEAIRAGVANSVGYFEIADTLESARNSARWRAPGFTTDGLHATPTGYAATVAGVDISKVTRS